jgi:hypothetical protein
MGFVSQAPRNATIQTEVASFFQVLGADQIEAIKADGSRTTSRLGKRLPQPQVDC